MVVHIKDISSQNICNTIATGGRGWPIATALEEGLRLKWNLEGMLEDG